MMSPGTGRHGRARWRKRLARGVACLVLGAVTTVGVAWGPLLAQPWFQPSRRWNVVVSSGGQSWLIDVGTGEGRTKFTAMVTGGFAELRPPRSDPPPHHVIAAADAATGMLPVHSLRQTPLGRRVIPRWARLPEGIAEDGSDTVANASITTIAAGWPSRCLLYTQRWVVAGPGNTVDGPRTTPPPSGCIHWNGRLLPARPIPLGLVTDTALYAAPWWLLLAAPGALKRWRRRRSGRCVDCGYDLAGLAVEDGARTCPECGAIARCAAPA